MLPEIIEYSCYMSFALLPGEKLQLAKKLIEASGLGFDMAANYLEFDYAGRDTNRKVVRLLGSLASIIGDAQGEVVCELAWEEADTSFEFYSIRAGQLLRQKGRIVRDEVEVLSSSEFAQHEHAA